jgi:hypothetical protein
MPLSSTRRLVRTCGAPGGLLFACLAALPAGCVSHCERHYPDGSVRVVNGLQQQLAARRPDKPCPKVSEAAVCLTFRPRTQLGLKRDGSDTPLLNRWRDRVGIPLENVDHFAVIVLDPEAGRRALVVRTTRPIEPGRVRVVLGAGTAGRQEGGTVYQARHGLTVAFPKPTLAILADSPGTMKACLGGIDSLRDLEEQAGHDLFFMVRALPPPRGEGRSGGCWCKAPPKVSLAGIPLPLDVKYATGCVDVADAVDVWVKVACADAECARKVVGLASTFLDLGRGILLAGSGQFNLMAVMGEEGNEEAKKIREMLPLDLAKPVVEALGQASLGVHGKTARLHLRLPIAGARAGKELKNYWSLAGGTAEVPDGPGLIFDAPSRPVAPVTPCAGPPPACPAPLPPAPPVTAPLPLSAPLPRDVPLPVPPVRGTVVVPPVQPLQPCVPPVGRLTVANCRKEPVVLFRVQTGGRLVFERKVEAGDAVDVQTSFGESWAAVFLSAPYRAQRVFQGAPVWLLRAESARADR